ncbi:MAG: hypothetical protein JKY37_07800 [Nannocystaceae bacterium]|nr:hypothetical protein [Nannocystaceae bacterium]
MIRRLSAAVVALALLLPAASAQAVPPPPDPKLDPSAADIDEARRLFENGDTKFANGNHEAAVLAFRRAFALSGFASCLYNIALIYDRTEDYQAALEYMHYYEVYAKDYDLDEFAEAVADLERRKELADEEALAQAELVEENDEPLGPIDSAPSDGRPIYGVGAIVATSIAAIGLGVGIGLGVTSQRRKDEASSACGLDPEGDRFCPGAAGAPLDASRRFALGADIAFGVGGVAAVTAIVLIAVRAAKNKRAQSALVPSRRGAALIVRF